MLVLSCCGASDADIVRDYARSAARRVRAHAGVAPAAAARAVARGGDCAAPRLCCQSAHVACWPCWSLREWGWLG